MHSGHAQPVGNLLRERRRRRQTIGFEPACDARKPGSRVRDA